MDVKSVITRPARTAFLGGGMLAGLVLALPVRTGAVACPPAHEGRVNCLVQHAWAPALVKLSFCLLASVIVWDVVCNRIPEAFERLRRGERPARREHDHGRAAVLDDSMLAAASWGVVPEARRPSRPEPAAAPEPFEERAAPVPETAPEESPAFVPALERLMARCEAEAQAAASTAAATAELLKTPADEIAAPAASDPAAEQPLDEQEVPSPPQPIRALSTSELHAARSRRSPRRLRVLGKDALRGRRLRPSSDQALVVALWSAVTAGRTVDDDLGVGVTDQLVV